MIQKPSGGQPSSRTTIEWPCRGCGSETKDLADTCLQCGTAVYGSRTETTKKAGELFNKTFTPVVVIVRRGGRSMRSTELASFRNYVKRAVKLGFASVTDRWYNDAKFRTQMSEQGWTNAGIGKIDHEAKETLQPGIRSREEIQATTATVWRNVGENEVDATVAPRWHMSQLAQKAQWQNAKKKRGLASTGSEGQPSSAASDPRGSAEKTPRAADTVLQWTTTGQSSSSSSAWQWTPTMHPITVQHGWAGHDWSSSSRNRDRSPNKIHGQWWS